MHAPLRSVAGIGRTRVFVITGDGPVPTARVGVAGVSATLPPVIADSPDHTGSLCCCHSYRRYRRRYRHNSRAYARTCRWWCYTYRWCRHCYRYRWRDAADNPEGRGRDAADKTERRGRDAADRTERRGRDAADKTARRILGNRHALDAPARRRRLR